MDTPFKHAALIIAYINGAELERRYVGQVPSVQRLFEDWQLWNRSRADTLAELAVESIDWEYREVPKDRVVFRCMSGAGVQKWWRDYETQQVGDGFDQFKITYDGREPGKIKRIDPV